MLQDIRDNSQGTIAKVIIGLICATFALVGVESILGGGVQTKAAEVNGTAITLQELQDSIRLQQRSLMAQMGERVDPAALDANKLAPQVLQSLVDRQVTLEQAADLGFEISKDQMNLAISENSQFQQDGKFSQDLFNIFTQNLSISPASFTDIYHSELLINQLSGGIISSAFITNAATDVDTLFTHQSRDVRFIKLTLDNALSKVSADDEQVESFYSANPQNYMSTEKVQLEYIELKLADYIKPASQEEIDAAYQAEVAAIDLTPVRQIAHILIDPAMHKDRAEADQIIADLNTKLAAGEKFEDLAKAYSDDFGSKEMGGFLGALSADVFPVAFYDAAAELQLNQVSQVVETESGLHLITVTALDEPEVPSLEDRQEALAIALSDANANPAFWAAVEELKDISFNAPDLNEPAEMLDVEVSSTMLFDRNTQDQLLSNPVFLQQAFNAELINEGVNSELIELSPEHAVVIRVIKHEPEALKDFALVKSQAKQDLLKSLAKDLLNQEAESVQAKLLEGDSVESVAKSLNLEWQAELSVKRSQNKLPPTVSQAAFSLGGLVDGQAAVDSVDLMDGSKAVVLVSNLQDGKPSAVQAREKSMMQTYLAQNKGALEYQALNNIAKEQADIEILR